MKLVLLRLWLRLLLVFSSYVLTQSLVLAQTDTDWTAINLAVTDTHVLPRYEQFAAAASTLVPAANQLCEQTSADTLANLQNAFHQTMDAWQGIQHVQFGPVTYFNWNFRVQYWPDDRNTGSRQLDALLAAQDIQLLIPENFARQSVGVQGLPALEQLLFAEQALTQLQEQAFRCQLVQAIAANLNDIAAGILARWRDEFRSTIATAQDSDYFESAQDATIDFYKALVETLRKYQEQKLVAVLGTSLAEARNRRAESWRSQRSLRNLKLNITALEHLFDGSTPALGSALLQDDTAKVRAGFDQLKTALATLPDDMAPLLQSETGYQQLATVEADMDALFEALEAALKNTDLYLGFNSLDGD